MRISFLFMKIYFGISKGMGINKKRSKLSKVNCKYHILWPDCMNNYFCIDIVVIKCLLVDARVSGACND